MGLDRNVDYQFGEGFVTLWTSVYAEILKICHMVYIHVGMYVSVSVCLYNIFYGNDDPVGKTGKKTQMCIMDFWTQRERVG